MQWQNSLYFWILVGSAVVPSLLAFHGWRNRNVRGASAFAALMLAGAVWSGSEALVVASPELGEKMFWVKMGSLGCIASSTTWLFLALQFTGRTRWLTWRHIAAISAAPALAVLLAWTDDFHHLIWQNVRLSQAPGFSYITWDATPVRLVFTIYIYGLLLFSAYLLAESIRRTGPPYRAQAAILLLGLLFPVVGSSVNSIGPESLRVYQFGPTLIGLAGITVGWGLLRYYLFDIGPVARDAVVEGMRDGVIVIDLRNRIVDCNHSARLILGLDQSSITGRQASEVFGSSPELVGFRPELAGAHTEFRSVVSGVELQYEVGISRLCNQSNRPIGHLLILHDITERKRLEEGLIYNSFHDPLTGLYNRAYFEEEMRRLEAGRFYPITIVGTDVDGLKLINDTMGHLAGDELLRSYSSVLQSSVRKADVAARVGGDEFALILPHTDEEMAADVCRRLENEANQHNQMRPSLPLSFSWGTQTSHGPEMPLDQAFRLADLNMYREKTSSRFCARRQMVDYLLAALITRDHGIEGHTQRVRDLAIRMGEAARLSEKRIAELELLSEVHDLGMVGVAESILLNTGPLTPQEREEIERHPVVGHKIAQSAPHLEHIASLILHHHEWWNGKGYPGGLIGEEIPLACRILAVADSFDSMTSDRLHRRATSRDEAISQIQAKAGTEFDPALVAMFVGIMRAERDAPSSELVTLGI